MLNGYIQQIFKRFLYLIHSFPSSSVYSPPFPFLFRERDLTRRTGASGTFYYYEEYIDECIALLLGIQERIDHMGLFLSYLPTRMSRSRTTSFSHSNSRSFFLFSIVWYICILFYFSMSHPKNISTSFLLYANSKLETKVSRRRKKKKKKRGGLQWIQNVRIQPISHFLLAFHDPSHASTSQPFNTFNQASSESVINRRGCQVVVGSARLSIRILGVKS